MSVFFGLTIHARSNTYLYTDAKNIRSSNHSSSDRVTGMIYDKYMKIRCNNG